MDAHKTVERYAGWVVIAALLFSAYWILSDYKGLIGLDTLFLIVVVLGVLAAIIVFTRPLKDSNYTSGDSLGSDHDNSDNNVNTLFRIGYGFIFLALVASFSIFIIKEPVCIPSAASDGKDLFSCEAPEAKAKAPPKPDVPVAKIGARQGGAGKPNSGNEDNNPQATKPSGSDTGNGKDVLTDGQTAHLADRRRISYSIAILPGCNYAYPEVQDPLDGLEPEQNGDEESGALLKRIVEVTLTPPGAYCDRLPPQWVLSIGGSVLSCHISGNCGQIDPQAVPENLSKLKKELKRKQDQYNDVRSKIVSIGNKIKANKILVGLGFVKINKDKDNELKDNLSKLSEQEKALKKDISNYELKIPDAEELRKPINRIEGSLISGGLVVPLYFIFLATLGALVGMMRKLPEFQRRASPYYWQNYDKDVDGAEVVNLPISSAKARELIIFQMLQVISAPVIGIVAYSWARPEDIAATAVLAFAAGFSSELFLVAIRATAERIIGTGLRSPPSRKVKPEKKPPVPPRGLNPPEVEKPVAGKFKTGDRVILQQPLGALMAGSRGIVLAIDDNNMLTVQATQDHEGIPASFILPAQGPEFFRSDDRPAAQGDDLQG